MSRTWGHGYRGDFRLVSLPQFPPTLHMGLVSRNYLKISGVFSTPLPTLALSSPMT